MQRSEVAPTAARPKPDPEELSLEAEPVAEPVPPINGARSIMASRQEPSDSLDYFPTPPFATRALIERVLPHLGVRPDRIGSAWECACGEGHMAGVLEEYPISVVATDVHDYSADGRIPPSWWRTLDFLTDQSTPVADWIITNPPFGDNAVPFVQRALDLAEVGVAMFFRTQWVVEGVERFNAIFDKRPPTLLAFFVERVPLAKGRWDPDGSTATAYSWVIWKRDTPPRPPLWIAPGCREALSKPADRDRFTSHPVRAFVPLHDPITGEIIPSDSFEPTSPPISTIEGWRDHVAGLETNRSALVVEGPATAEPAAGEGSASITDILIDEIDPARPEPAGSDNRVAEVTHNGGGDHVASVPEKNLQRSGAGDGGPAATAAPPVPDRFADL